MRSAVGGWVEKRLPMPAARERVGDHEGAGGGQLRVLRQRHRPGARLDLAQGGGEGEGVAGEAGAGGVGLVLAGAADGHLDDGGGDGAEDEHQQGAEQAGAVVVVVAAERDEDRHVGQVGDDGGDRGGHGGDEDVAVVDVRQLVAEDGAQLPLVEDLEDAAGAADGGVARVASGGERVRLRGSPRCTGAASAGARTSRVRGRAGTAAGASTSLDRVGAHGAQRDAVAEEVGDAVGAERDDQCDRQPGPAADHPSGGEHQCRQRADQRCRLDTVELHFRCLPVDSGMNINGLTWVNVPG